MEEKERRPYPQSGKVADPDDPAMKCVYFGPRPIPNTLLGYAGPKPCPDDAVAFGTATPSDAKKTQNTDPGEYVICSACGAKIPEKAKFCPECGAINKSR